MIVNIKHSAIFTKKKTKHKNFKYLMLLFNITWREQESD